MHDLRRVADAGVAVVVVVVATPGSSSPSEQAAVGAATAAITADAAVKVLQEGNASNT